VRSQRLGFDVRIENSRDVDRVGDSSDVLMSRDRVVRSVVRHARWSHDEIRSDEKEETLLFARLLKEQNEGQEGRGERERRMKATS